MPRKKRASDELYNARRRLRRQAERVAREAQKQVGVEKQLSLGYARSLRETAKASGKRLTKEQQMRELERLQGLREVTRGGAQGRSRVHRRNVIFVQQMNAAGTKGADSSIKEGQRDIFWLATKGLWTAGEYVPRNQRYERIVDYFYSLNAQGRTSDEQDFRNWLEEEGIDIRENYGDLQLVFEYLTQRLNAPQVGESDEYDYEEIKKLVLTVR